MGDKTKNKEPPVGEWSASPPEINPHLFPHNNAPDQVLKSRESVQKDTFFSKHVTSEEVKEAARVSQVLEEVNYANSRAATSETQTI